MSAIEQAAGEILRPALSLALLAAVIAVFTGACDSGNTTENVLHSDSELVPSFPPLPAERTGAALPTAAPTAAPSPATSTRSSSTPRTSQAPPRSAAAVPDEPDRVVDTGRITDARGEVWASLADNGWGPAYRDNRKRDARFMNQADVEVLADGTQLVFRFPLRHLNRATMPRWSTTAEWGSFEMIAAGAAARDRAPDSGPAPFPD